MRTADDMEKASQKVKKKFICINYHQEESPALTAFPGTAPGT